MNDGGLGVYVWIVMLVAVVCVVSIWKVFAKADMPGWACLIPIYNGIVMMRIAGRPGWWILLCVIPIVNVVVGIIVLLEVARSFGKGPGFGLGLIFLGFIFFPILGFGDARYLGPAHRG